MCHILAEATAMRTLNFTAKRFYSSNVDIENDAFEKAISKENVLKCIERMKRFKIGGQIKPGSNYASVFVPFCHNIDNEPSILFTRRSFKLTKHKGEMCFPGGFEEQGDKDAVASAVRELIEEIGVDIKDVDVYGQLNRLPFNQIALHPVLGYLNLKSIDNLKINHDEVDSVHIITLKELIDMDNWFKTSFTHGWTIPVFLDKDRVHPRIWGFTATLLYLTLVNLMPKHFAFDFSYLIRG